MKQYRLTAVDNELGWNTALGELDNYHFLQSWQWGEIKTVNGWKADRFLIKTDNVVVAAFQLLTKRIHPKIPITIGYTPRGPAFDPDKIDMARLLYTVEQAARNSHCAYVKVDTDIEETTIVGKKWTQTLRENGWSYSTQQLQTKNTGVTDLLVDDPNGEDKLLSSMKKTWRYNIRSSARRGIVIQKGTYRDMEKFYKLYETTGSRQNFVIRPLVYYREVYRAFHEGKDTDSMILLSKHPDEKDPLTSSVFIRFHKKVWYFYSASSVVRREDMPNYLLQWEALRWSRNNGAIQYDWGGASTNPDDPNDPMARVWHFKKGFGAKYFSGAGAWDKPINITQWYLLLALTKAKKIFKR